MAAVADGAVGGDDRPPHGSVIREDPSGQAAPGDGLPRLSGDHSAGEEVLECAHGGCGGACAADGRMPLSQRRIDSEKLAGPATAAGHSGCAIVAAPTAQQHSRSRVLRISKKATNKSIGYVPQEIILDATRTDDGETTGHAAARHGRRIEGAAAGPGRSRAELPRPSGDADRSPVELAPESGPGATPALRQTPRQRLRRGCRLPRGARLG